MANASIAQSVNRNTVRAALQEARRQCGQQLRWLNALNRAALNLEACPWQFDGETLVISSATSSTRYTVDACGCGCRAAAKGNPCWHRAARRLLVKAAEMAYPASATNGYQDAPAQPFTDARPSFAELTAAVNAELY